MKYTHTQNLLTATGNETGSAFVNAGNTGAKSRGDASRHIVFVVVSAAATCTVEFSLDDTTYYTLHATVNDTESYSISEAYPYLRATVSSYSSGTVTVDMALYYE